MTHGELIAELVRRRALIVHCSRPGKGDVEENARFFPDDMLEAISFCGNLRKEVYCSVIWPGHVDAFGEIGIVIKPRSTQAITMVCNTDGGTSRDPKTGRLIGAGVSFSGPAVKNTFENSIGYNEWDIDDADTVGVFVASRSQFPMVAALQNLADLPGYDPVMGAGTVVGNRFVQFSEIAAAFPALPILTIEDGEIVDIAGDVASPYA